MTNMIFSFVVVNFFLGKLQIYDCLWQAIGHATKFLRSKTQIFCKQWDSQVRNSIILSRANLRRILWMRKALSDEFRNKSHHAGAFSIFGFFTFGALTILSLYQPHFEHIW